MGGTESRPLPDIPIINPAEYATVPENIARAAQDQALAAKSLAEEAAARASESAGWGWFYAKSFLGFIFFAGVVLGILYAIDAISIKFYGKTIIGLLQPPPSTTPSSQILYIDSATYGPIDSTGQTTSVTSSLSQKIQNQTLLPSFTVGYAELGLPSEPNPGVQKTLTIKWHVGNCSGISNTFVDGQSTTALSVSAYPPGQCTSFAPNSTVSSSWLSSLFNTVTGSVSSGDLLSGLHDATQGKTISASSAPLSSESQGGYGMQWWMFIKDWNYGYGKEKSVVLRTDPTNSAIKNPAVSLHPTDNTLKISVSVFPTTEGGQKAEPGPAGGSGNETDDVYICEVANIPLQKWFAVGVTVFGRNLDVYLDGKLVKSCFLSGVPKPATGDIQISSGGGFSGYMCNYYHYPRMLTPGDTMNFASSGTTCQSEVPSQGSGVTASGYSVKFGVYDSMGKEVQEYTF